MKRPDKRQIERLKKQDKELEKVSLKKEEKKFKQGESYLKRLIVPEPIESDVKRMVIPERKSKNKRRG